MTRMFRRSLIERQPVGLSRDSTLAVGRAALDKPVIIAGTILQRGDE